MDQTVFRRHPKISCCSKASVADFIKLVAKNHQYLGVDNAIHAFNEFIDENKGKLPVFWHTQGSGKSFSMVFFTQKSYEKFQGTLPS